MKSEFRDWSDVRVFLAVARAGSTLAASRELGMAQPTVARRIDALEHALQLVLFERDTRGFRPTPEGQALVAKAEALEAAARSFSERATALIAGRTQTIRFTAFKDAFNHRLASVVEAFVDTHPGVKFDFIASDDNLDLAKGEADVALRGGREIGDPTLICRKVREVSFSLFASKGYAERHRLPATEADLGGHRFAVYVGRLAGQGYNRWLLDRIDPDQIATTCDSGKSMAAAVLMGTGIGPLATRSGLEQPNITCCLNLPPETGVPIWLVMAPDAWRRPEVKAFAAFFVPRYRALFAEAGS
jgi:DNA-binding transcriptional LysR family regulator